MPRKRDPSKPPGALATAETTAATHIMSNMARVFRSDVPRHLFKALKWGLYQEGKVFKKWFREDVKGKFKVANSKVGNLFRVYTAGDRIGNLTLGMFSIWEAAPMYEGVESGTITAKGRWLLFLVNKEGLTAGGRVRRAWRDSATGKFAAEKLEGLIWVKVKYGVYHLIKPPSPGRRGAKAELMFIAIRQTTRTPKLNFFRSWENRILAGGRLEAEMNSALDRAMSSI